MGLAQSSAERITKPPALLKMYRWENSVCAVMSASALAGMPLRTAQPLCCQNVSANCRAFTGPTGVLNAQLISKIRPKLKAIFFIEVLLACKSTIFCFTTR